jgi:SNF2 family DNA or RNA helicase
VRVIETISKRRGIIAIHGVGTGKTLTATIAMHCYLQSYPKNRVFIVTPASLLANFRKGIMEYGGNPNDPRIKYYTFDAFARAKSACRGGPHMLIVDEAHNIRTSIYDGGGIKSKALTKCAKHAHRVILMTATPLVNSVHDIGNLVAMVDGVEPPKSSELDAIFSSKSATDMYLRNKISIYIPRSRRNFPETRNSDILIPMSSEYERAYEKLESALVDEYKKKYGDRELSQAFYSGLRQSNNSIDRRTSPKVDWILDYLRKNTKKPQARPMMPVIRGMPMKVVIYSAFIDYGSALIGSALDKVGIKYIHIDGALSKDKRALAVAAYNTDQVNVLLISRAGAEGLDLKHTTTVIHFEPAWNETVARQVTGRGVRYKSHADLNPTQQVVDNFRLHLVKRAEHKKYKRVEDVDPTQGKVSMSVDIYIAAFSRAKQIELDHTIKSWKKYSIERNQL